MTLIIFSSTLLCGAGIVCLWIWFCGTFKEPHARKVPSLARYLSSRSILAVFAHPDDEIFVVGAISEAIRSGVNVYAVTATRGQGGAVFTRVGPVSDIAALRCAELRKHYSLIGVEDYEIWNFEDAKLAEEADEFTLRLVDCIRRVRPDTILTFDPKSGYTGHPDHIATGQAVLDALGLAENPSFRSDFGPPHRVSYLVYFLAPTKAMRIFGGPRGKMVAKNQVPVQLAVPVQPALKIRGWKAHGSQWGYLTKVWHIHPSILYRCFDSEYFWVDKRIPM